MGALRPMRRLPFSMTNGATIHCAAVPGVAKPRDGQQQVPECRDLFAAHHQQSRPARPVLSGNEHGCSKNKR